MIVIVFLESLKSQFPTLSKSQQKIAKYLMDQPQQFAIKSAGEIGKAVGVSETTVIRFCYSLQFNGFSEMQKTVRESLLLPKSSLDQYYSNKLELVNQPHFFTNVMDQDCHNIKRTAEQIEESHFQEVVNHLIQAKQIFITGLHSSYAAAHWLSFTLGLMRERVFLYKPDTDHLLMTLDRMNDQSVFLAISFHRYLKETVKMAELAKKQGATVIGITDSSVAPISQYADVILTISQPEKSTLDAMPSLFSLLNALIANVSVQNKEQFEKRKQQYETLNVDYLFCD
ncbi:MurR/RpiR family transcriptional regulator [Bacillus sp. UNC438CL73TsuS30]|uniref:MurR/RpiR family transcriptional regulator n=1 Tax=Bacillus sp. UNC438CL73TsuS30 TaxID=1340434 RepID=UPI002F35B6B1